MGFVLAIMKFPDQQRKAQEEIDRIVGRERMPVTADRENLPFIRACVFEVDLPLFDFQSIDLIRTD